MPNRCERLGAVSVLILTSFSRPGLCCAICSTIGETTRQGPHQGAQKSISTGRALSSTTAAYSASPVSVSQGRAAPQTPQCGTPPAAGRTRFCRPQFGQRVSGASSAISSRARQADRAKLIERGGGHQDSRDLLVGCEEILPVLDDPDVDPV